MRVALGRLSIVLLAWTVSAVAPVAAQQPQPDVAPQAAPLAPDPAPGTSPVVPAPSQPETYIPPSQPVAPAPAPAEPQYTPSAPTATTPRRDKPAGAQRRAGRSRAQAGGRRAEPKKEAAPAPAERPPLARIGSLLPSSEPANDSRHLFLLAAGALLALLMASSSLISVASRATRGRLR